MVVAAQIGIEDVLEVVTKTFQIDGDLHGDEFGMLCPVHADTNPSADVNVVSGLWSCFSCGEKGDLVDLGVAALHQIPPSSEWKERKPARDDIMKLLAPGSPDAKLASIQRKLANHRKEAVPRKERGEMDMRNLHKPSAYDIGPYDYLYERGFSKAMMKRWRVRYTEATTLIRQEDDEDKLFTLEHSIVIPVRDEDNKLLAWCYRRTDASAGWQPKYIYTPKFDTARHWFGAHLHANSSYVVLVEGPLDAMWLDQHGIPALAMMGSSHKNRDKFRLLERYEKVIILPDYDRAGIFMTESVGSTLRGRVPTFVCRWPQPVIKRTGKEEPDPQDIRNPRDLKLVVSRSIPWGAWNMRQSLHT